MKLVAVALWAMVGGVLASAGDMVMDFPLYARQTTNLMVSYLYLSISLLNPLSSFNSNPYYPNPTTATQANYFPLTDIHWLPRRLPRTDHQFRRRRSEVRGRRQYIQRLLRGVEAELRQSEERVWESCE